MRTVKEMVVVSFYYCGVAILPSRLREKAKLSRMILCHSCTVSFGLHLKKSSTFRISIGWVTWLFQPTENGEIGINGALNEELFFFKCKPRLSWCKVKLTSSFSLDTFLNGIQNWFFFSWNTKQELPNTIIKIYSKMK